MVFNDLDLEIIPGATWRRVIPMMRVDPADTEPLLEKKRLLPLSAEEISALAARYTLLTLTSHTVQRAPTHAPMISLSSADQEMGLDPEMGGLWLEAPMNKTRALSSDGEYRIHFTELRPGHALGDNVELFASGNLLVVSPRRRPVVR